MVRDLFHIPKTLSENTAKGKRYYASLMKKITDYLGQKQKTNAHFVTCLSGAAKLARRQRGEKNCDPRERGRKLEHRAARSQHGSSAVVVFAHSFLLFYTKITSTERDAFAVENCKLSALLRQQFCPYTCRLRVDNKREMVQEECC